MTDSSLLRKIVQVEFLDHADGLGLVRCRVVGEVREMDDERLVLCRWVVVGEDPETTRDNEEYYTIVTSTIKSLKVAVVWQPHSTSISESSTGAPKSSTAQSS